MNFVEDDVQWYGEVKVIKSDDYWLASHPLLPQILAYAHSPVDAMMLLRIHIVDYANKAKLAAKHLDEAIGAFE